MDELYYVVELMDVENNTPHSILCSEEALNSIVSNYDKDIYKLVNVYGLGQLDLDYMKFTKKPDNLETGDNNVEK